MKEAQHQRFLCYITANRSVGVCRYNTEQYSPYAAPSPQGSYQPSPSPQSYHQVAPSPVGYQNTHSPASYHPTPSPMAYQVGGGESTDVTDRWKFGIRILRASPELRQACDVSFYQIHHQSVLSLNEPAGVPTGQSQSESCGLQSHDARSALSWRLQPPHPGLQHRAGRQRLGDHRHPGPSEGLVHGPDGADRGHQEHHGEILH